MRKLASIQTITKIEPIDGADKIELAHVLGWQCVVNKGVFKEGDKGVYFEVDSFLPETEEFEFLRKSSFRKNELLGSGFKLRTMTFRGQLSQGLLLPMSILPDGDYEVGDDVSQRLGVIEWQQPEMLGDMGTLLGDRPNFIPKTDETRVQSDPQLLEEFRGKPYYITTKMDGTSCSIGVDTENTLKYTTHFNTIKDDGKSPFISLIKDSGISDKLLAYKNSHSDIKTITVQGELCGSGIQKNRLKLTKLTWYVFTVIINDKRVNLETLQSVCKEIGANMVPLEEKGDDLLAKYPNIESLLVRADGNYPNGGKKEGIVIRPIEPCMYGSSPLSMKVINNKYLLKYED